MGNVSNKLKEAIQRKKRDVKASRTFEVRDNRDKAFFWLDDAYLNGWAKICGVYATAVYLSLCRHVGKDQMCWPSVALIAQEHSMSQREVYRALKILKHHRIIDVKRTRKGSVNLYSLTKKKHWVMSPRVAPIPETVDSLSPVYVMAEGSE